MAFATSPEEKFGRDVSYSYSPDDYIGRGTFGVIYKGKIKRLWPFSREQTSQETVVAVKVIHLFNEDTEADWIKRRERLKSLIDLKQENIVVYHKIVIRKLLGGGRVEIVMDFYEGGDLACLLKDLEENRLVFGEKTALTYAQEIAKGLQFLHESDIIHGDLKPGNVFVKRLGPNLNRLLIGDLDDLVPMQQSATCTRDITTYRGTMRYMSPEMLRRMVQLPGDSPGRKTDIWSLGCIILELADRVTENTSVWLQTDKRDLESEDQLSDNDYMKFVIDGNIPRTSAAAPPSLAACVERCLCTSSQDRASANVILDRLHQASRSSKQPLVFIHMDSFFRVFIEMPEISSWKISQTRLPKSLDTDECPVTCAAACTSLVYLFQTRYDRKDKADFLDVIEWNVRQDTWTTCFLCSKKAWKNVFMDSVVPTQGLCSIAVNSKIYFLAIGRNPGKTRRVFLVEADSVTKSARSFFSLRPELECSSGTTTTTRHGTKIFYLTTSGKGSWMGSFDTVTKEWESLPALSYKRRGYASVALGDHLYILGGYDGEAGELSKSCHRYNTRSRKWEDQHDLMYPRMNHCAFVLRNRICVYGGIRNWRPRQPVPTMEVYDPDRDNWAEVTIDRPLSDIDVGGLWWNTLCTEVA